MTDAARYAALQALEDNGYDFDHYGVSLAITAARDVYAERVAEALYTWYAHTNKITQTWDQCSSSRRLAARRDAYRLLDGRLDDDD